MSFKGQRERGILSVVLQKTGRKTGRQKHTCIWSVGMVQRRITLCMSPGIIDFNSYVWHVHAAAKEEQINLTPFC